MRLLRITALIAIPAGAAGAVILFFRASDHPPALLVALFILWLVSPFALLGWVHAASQRWSQPTQTTAHVTTLLITLASLAIYSGLLIVTPAGSAKAAPFVVVAPTSWLLTAVAVSLAAFLSRGMER